MSNDHAIRPAQNACDRPPVLVIAGPTASGKSEIALSVAMDVGGEIVSADSMQVYKYMDIGTAKPSAEEQQMVRHHMIDIVCPDQRFTVADFQRIARKCIADTLSRTRLPIIVGGTGLYIDSILESFSLPAEDEAGKVRRRLAQIVESQGQHALHAELARVDPISADRIHPNNVRRVIRALEVYYLTGRPMSEAQRRGSPEFDAAFFCLSRDRQQLYLRIDDRVDAMIRKGLVHEVAWLLERYDGRLATAAQAIGYKEIIAYLEERCSLADAVETLKRDTRRYAKRQLTWFQRKESVTFVEIDGPGGRDRALAVISNEAKRLAERICQQRLQAPASDLCSLPEP